MWFSLLIAVVLDVLWIVHLLQFSNSLLLDWWLWFYFYLVTLILKRTPCFYLFTLGLEGKAFSSIHKSIISDFTWQLLPLPGEGYLLCPQFFLSLMIACDLKLEKSVAFPVFRPFWDWLLPDWDNPGSETEYKCLLTLWWINKEIILYW